ncbi:AhpC-TSA-domain-containing protein [Parachaetomium inaequale]|uniref:thioredoxin-dependent peroxiredoxin n=1 Tax=Parachaetomium inaequale TaxID=2588326 RepID=A0AAN6SME1_9PEZI|nr:AhpC-TSA-domain-containing protein [Parachaetomium inaequale]
MPMELRKRKEAPAPPPPARKKTTKTAAATAKTAAAKAKDAVKEKVAEVAAAAPTNGASDKPAVGTTIALDGFGGEIETNDGAKTTLKALVDESKAGVVLFTYPKASTPGCTRQACLFRDAYTALTSTSGLAIYGLSTDSPKANTTFQTKQKLPYPLLCDPDATLIGAIGLKKAPKGTTRGVFVVDKTGKVLASQAGGPEATVGVVREVVEGLVGGSEEVKGAVEEAEKEEGGKDEEGKGEDVPMADEAGEANEEEGKKAEENGEGEKKEE